MITTELIGGDAVIAKLDDLPNRIKAELKIGIGRVALKLQIKVQREKLMGQVLKVRTNRLKRSIDYVVEETASSVSGVVSTPIKYAPYQEYGFHGTQTVREQLRTIKEAFGRPIAPKQILVKEHTRKVDYPAHSFLRSALAELKASGVIEEEIDAALARAAKG